MSPLAWITSCRQSGSATAHLLLVGYLFDAPPEEVSQEAALAAAPDLFQLYNWGRTVPLDERRPHVVRTYALPGEQIIAPYREATGKVVYVVRDPRALISAIVHGGRVKPGDRSRTAVELVGALGAIPGFGPSRATWEEHVAEWTIPERARAHFPGLSEICVVRYEDLTGDPAAVLRRLVAFLGTMGPVDDDRIKRTLAAWTPDAVREAPISSPLPGIEAFRDPRPRPGKAPGEPPPLAEISPDAEEAYRRRIADDAAFAALVQRFGYLPQGI